MLGQISQSRCVKLASIIVIFLISLATFTDEIFSSTSFGIHWKSNSVKSFRAGKLADVKFWSPYNRNVFTERSVEEVVEITASEEINSRDPTTCSRPSKESSSESRHSAPTVMLPLNVLHWLTSLRSCAVVMLNRPELGVQSGMLA